MMLWGLIQFQLHLFMQFFRAGYYRDEFIIDDTHPHYRRFSKKYKKKQGIVKNFWIIAGLITLAFPLPQVAVVIFAITTCVSFCLLDETP